MVQKKPPLYQSFILCILNELEILKAQHQILLYNKAQSSLLFCQFLDEVSNKLFELT